MSTLVLMTVLSLSLHAQVPRSVFIEPEARKILAEMVKAYRSVRSLEMQTTYHGEMGGFSKPVSARLVLRRPNRLFYEVWQNTPGVGRTTAKRYICDGKFLYIYDEAEGYYSREKAPRDFKGMGLTGAGLEFAAISGTDPFANLERQVHTARVLGMDVVEGDAVDVVLLDSGTPDRTSEARLYVSRTSRMLRRFAFESVVLKKPEKRPPLEPLNPDDPHEQDAELHVPPVKFHYDNTWTIDPRIPDSLFVWKTPPGALLYEPLHQMLDPGRFRNRPSYEIVGPDGKRKKPLTYRELVEMARKQARKRR